MKRALWIVGLALAARGGATAQPLPDEVTRFYQDWNLVVAQTTLPERRALWQGVPAPGAGEERLAGAREALERIRARWVTRPETMPRRGYDGFPVWSMRLEVAGAVWDGEDTLRLSITAYPTRISVPAGPALPEASESSGIRLGLTHTWRRQNGLWTVVQELGVLT